MAEASERGLPFSSGCVREGARQRGGTEVGGEKPPTTHLGGRERRGSVIRNRLFGVVYVTLAQHATLVTTSDHSTRAKQTQTTLTVGPSSCGRRQHLCHPSAASWLGTLLACFNPEGDAKRFANSLACNRGTPGIALCSATFSNLQHDDPIPFPERFTLQGPLLSNRSALLDYRIPSSMVISFTALSRLVPRLKLDQRSMSRGSRRNGSKYCRTIGMRAKGSRASILTTCG
jgi:hypothetical protein